MVRSVIGGAVVLVPIILAVIAVVLMRTEPDPDARPRLILGSAMIALPVLGLWHIWAGAPLDPADRRQAAGFRCGFVLGGPLSDGLTVWIATPLLVIGAMFGLLLLTGTHPSVSCPTRCAPCSAPESSTTTTTSTTTRTPNTTRRRLRGASHRGLLRRVLRRRLRRRAEVKHGSAAALPAGSPMDNYPLPGEVAKVESNT